MGKRPQNTQNIPKRDTSADKRIRGEVKPPAAKKDEINMDNFDPNSEFADDPLAYDIIKHNYTSESSETEESSAEEESNHPNCGKDCDCDVCLIKFMGLEINVITKEETFILDLIDQITDPLEKRKAIEHYISIASSSKEKVKEPKESKLTKQITQEGELYSYNKILERANLKEKEPTICELNKEINIINLDHAQMQEDV